MFGLSIKEKNQKEWEKLRFPIKIKTDDGFLEISLFPNYPILKIKQTHLKGKSFAPHIKFQMNLSDPQFINDESDIIKKTWTQTFYLPAFLPNTVKELGRILTIIGDR